MRNLLFFIPLMYTYCTRLRTFLKCFSLVCIYFVPVVYLLVLVLPSGYWSVKSVLFVFLFLVALYDVYEIGYIQNDTETVKKEVTPTSRLSREQLEYYGRHRWLIYVCRAAIGGVLVACLYDEVGTAGTVCFTCALLLILLTYQLYNRLRCHVNMLLYFMLVSLRYCTPFLLFPEYFSVELLVTLLMVFPIVKTLEYRSTKPPHVTTNIFFRKYILKFDSRRLTLWRVAAYGILSAIAVVLYFNGFFSAGHVIVVVYMFCFRLGIYALIKMGANPKGYLEG